MPKKKTTKESDKALLGRITREMAKPRVAESAQAEGRNRYRLAQAIQLKGELTTPDNTGKEGKL